MPVKLTKLKSGKVRVRTPGGIKSRSTSLKKAKSQERLLNAIEHNPDFVPKKEASGIMNKKTKFRQFQKAFGSNLGIRRKKR